MKNLLKIVKAVAHPKKFCKNKKFLISREGAKRRSADDASFLPNFA